MYVHLIELLPVYVHLIELLSVYVHLYVLILVQTRIDESTYSWEDPQLILSLAQSCHPDTILSKQQEFQ